MKAGGPFVAVKKKTRTAIKKAEETADDKPGMTLRLPIDLREAITEESRVKGDLARIVLFALSQVDREKWRFSKPARRVWGFPIRNFFMSGQRPGSALKEWAESKGVSINAIVVSVLEEFFKRLKKSKALREELKLELRAHRSFTPQ
jgi:hypothetical protein